MARNLPPARPKLFFSTVNGSWRPVPGEGCSLCSARARSRSTLPERRQVENSVDVAPAIGGMAIGDGRLLLLTPLLSSQTDLTIGRMVLLPCSDIGQSLRLKLGQFSLKPTR